MNTLNVFWDGARVGTLFDSRPLSFTYDPRWLAEPAARVISPSLPLQAESHTGEPVVAFFENLLPEGRVRHSLSVSHHASTVFGLLCSIAGDTAGILVLLPPGQLPAPPCYLPTTWAALARRLAQCDAISDTMGAHARISLAGAQSKLPIMVLPDGSPAYPQGTAPSSHILKPDIRGLKGVWASALNEAFVMRLAAVLGLGVAGAEYQPDTRSCLVRRYDRAVSSGGSLIRLHQLDLCQLAGKPSDVKYESDGGPPLQEIRMLLQQMGVPAGDLKRLLLWVLFNLCVGNHDSHAKNVSVVFTEDGWRLAPFYDLMCTALYPGLSRTFAFRIGGQRAPARIGRAELEAMATELGFKPRYVLHQAHELAQALPASVDTTVQELGAVARPGVEQTLLARLHRFLKSNTRKCARRW